jgi:hypothetical protein
MPKMPGDVGAAHTEAPARVALMAIGADGSPYYRGKVEAAPAGGGTVAAASRGGTVSFDAAPGKVQLRVSVEGISSQVLDTETRDLTVPDLTSPASLGTPAVFRARTLRDYQQLKADAAAMPTAAREFSRTDRILIRVPAYGPAATTPTLSVHLLNRTGQPMSEIPATAAPSDGEQQVEVPLSGLAPGEYVVEIKATAASGEAQELVAFRVTS